MRQARRSYRHLPGELHEQAFDQAAVAMRTGAPSGLNRRALYGELAEELDAQLRRIHVGWCLNQARVPTPGTVPAAPLEPDAPQQPLTAFIDEGLGGLERAVLQLELGAGRDTSTSRAALRLGPRQYARHRELGLGKLRGAISGAISGRVCDQHLQAVTLAATGDREAADGLTSGPERCRSCAREAAGLRRVMQQRLAFAPWPLAIKPAGVLVAKLGALSAVLGKGGGAGAAGAGLTSAKLVGGVIATAALATGGIAVVGSDSEPAKPKPVTAAPAVKAIAAPPATAAKPASGARSGASSTAGQGASSSAAEEGGTGGAPAGGSKAAAPAAGAAPERESSAETPVAPAAKPKPAADPVREKVEDVKKGVDEVTSKLPAPVPPVVETVVPEVEKAVDGVTGTVEGATGTAEGAADGAAGTVDELLTP
jgi:hypothetical protein